MSIRLAVEIWIAIHPMLLLLLLLIVKSILLCSIRRVARRRFERARHGVIRLGHCLAEAGERGLVAEGRMLLRLLVLLGMLRHRIELLLVRYVALYGRLRNRAGHRS